MNALIISPEGLEVANKYLELGGLKETALALNLPQEKVSELLDKPEVKRYIDSIYLDSGYRNRVKIANLMDEIIESKLLEARESEVFTNKDLLEVLKLAHEMRRDEIKIRESEIKNQTNIQINATENNVFGSGNYGALMKRLLGEPVNPSEN